MIIYVEKIAITCLPMIRPLFDTVIVVVSTYEG